MKINFEDSRFSMERRARHGENSYPDDLHTCVRSLGALVLTFSLSLLIRSKFKMIVWVLNYTPLSY